MMDSFQSAPMAAIRKGMEVEVMAPGSDVRARSTRLNRPSFSAVLRILSSSSCTNKIG